MKQQTASVSVAPLTVIILTFNEESNIERVLRSVLGWAAEVFVVDSYSTDKTVDIAMQIGGKRVQIAQHRFENYSAQWNWAISHLPVTQPWVMKLDADEIATEEFREEVVDLLAKADSDQSAFIVHWKMIFMGTHLRWGGFYPNGNTRIWRHGKARFEDRDSNEHLVVEGEVGEVKRPIEHHDYKSLSHWLSRHNRYSSMEARAIADGNMVGGITPRLFGRPDERRMWLRTIYYQLPCRPLVYFFYRYVFRLGFLDGTMGFRFVVLYTAFLYWIDLKRWEQRHTGAQPEVLWQPRGEAHPAIRDSELQRLVDGKSIEVADRAA